MRLPINNLVLMLTPASGIDGQRVNDEQTITLEAIIGVLAETTGYDIDFLRRAKWQIPDRRKYEETELKAKVGDSQLLAAILDGRRILRFLKSPHTITLFGSSDHLENAAADADIILFGAKGTAGAADLRFGTCVIDFKRVADDSALDAVYEELRTALKLRRVRAIVFLNVDHASAIARQDIETIMKEGKVSIGPTLEFKFLNFAEALFSCTATDPRPIPI